MLNSKDDGEGKSQKYPLPPAASIDGMEAMKDSVKLQKSELREVGNVALYLTTAMGALGKVRKVALVTTPKVPPPPPRSAQKSLGFWQALAVRCLPCFFRQRCVAGHEKRERERDGYISSHDCKLQNIVRRHSLPYTQRGVSAALHITPCRADSIGGSRDYNPSLRRYRFIKLMQLDTGTNRHRVFRC
jgi:hypothetical protein